MNSGKHRYVGSVCGCPECERRAEERARLTYAEQLADEPAPAPGTRAALALAKVSK